jgi:hypothetical protein
LSLFDANLTPTPLPSLVLAACGGVGKVIARREDPCKQHARGSTHPERWHNDRLRSSNSAAVSLPIHQRSRMPDPGSTSSRSAPLTVRARPRRQKRPVHTPQAPPATTPSALLWRDAGQEPLPNRSGRFGLRCAFAAFVCIACNPVADRPTNAAAVAGDQGGRSMVSG